MIRCRTQTMLLLTHLIAVILMSNSITTSAALPVYSSETQEYDVDNQWESKRSAEAPPSSTELELLFLRKEILEDILRETQTKIEALQESDTEKPIELESRYIGQSPHVPRPSRGRKKKTSRTLDDNDMDDINKLNEILKQLEAKEKELETQTTTPQQPLPQTTENYSPEVDNELYKKLLNIDSELNQFLKYHGDDSNSQSELTKRRNNEFRNGNYPKRVVTSTNTGEAAGTHQQEESLLLSLLGDKTD